MGHIRLIIDKAKGDRAFAKFYIRETIENGWSRSVLMNYLDTNLYERQGKAVTNFSKTLPAPQSNLAQEITRDPYNSTSLPSAKITTRKSLRMPS